MTSTQQKQSPKQIVEILSFSIEALQTESIFLSPRTVLHGGHVLKQMPQSVFAKECSLQGKKK